MSEAEATPATAELTALQRHLYCCGHFAVSAIGIVLVGGLQPYYFPTEPDVAKLAPGFLVAYIMGIGRVTDGINDPIVGYLSDNLRTRWGRRKPFMAGAIPFMCALFLLVWYPPRTAESVTNFTYAAAIMVLFFVAFTLYVGPYVAMLSEIARSAEERLKLSSLQGIYNIAGLIAGSFMAGLALKRGGLSHQELYQEMAWIIAAVSAPFLILPLFGPRDDPDRVAAQEKVALVQSIVLTLRNRPFRIYITSHLLFLLGLMVIVSALPYMGTTLLDRDQGEGLILSGIALLAGAACVPYVLRRAEREGPKATYLFSLRWLAAAAPLLALLTLFGRYTWGVWAARALVLVPGVAIGGLYALPYAILSGITDYDRKQTGMNRQGILFCVQGMILKIAFAGGPWVAVQIADMEERHAVVGFTLVGPLIAVLALASHAVFRRYPDEEVRQALAADAPDSEAPAVT